MTWHTAVAAAEFFGVKKTTLRDWKARKKITTRRLPGKKQEYWCTADGPRLMNTEEGVLHRWRQRIKEGSPLPRRVVDVRAAAAPKKALPWSFGGPLRAPEPVKLPPIGSVSDRPYRVVSLFDVHVPDHDERALSAVLGFLADNPADCVVIGGDFLELESMSQHGGNARPASFREDIDAGRAVLARIRAVAPDATMVYLEGNHETRHTRKVINLLAELDGYNSIPEALSLAELGIEWVPYKKTWRPTLPTGVRGKLHYTHGQWATKHHACKHLDVHGVSIRYGHTHKPQSFTRGYADGVVRIGIGSPCLRTLDPDWIGETSGWCNGFGLDEFMGDGTFTALNVVMADRRFSYGGKVY